MLSWDPLRRRPAHILPERGTSCPSHMETNVLWHRGRVEGGSRCAMNHRHWNICLALLLLLVWWHNCSADRRHVVGHEFCLG
eukprot:scaffold50383_cov35-Tisochrysis_lutea.AAC.1